MTSKKLPTQPLLIPVFAALAGTGWFAAGIQCSPLLLVLAISMLLPLALHAYYQDNSILKKTLVFCIPFLTVGLIAQSAFVEFNRIYAACKNKQATVTGTIASISLEGKKQKITLKNIRISTPQEELRTSWLNSASVFYTGNIVLALNTPVAFSVKKLKKTPRDLAFYLLKEHSLGFFFPQPNELKICADEPKKSNWLDCKKEALQQLILTTFSPTTAQHIQSIFLGQTALLKNSTRRLFEIWGISHYLARSGLHLVVLVVLVSLILSACMIPLTFARIVTIAVVFLYHALTLPSVSFLRALLMNFAFAGAFLTGTTPNSLHIFFAVTLITILANPFVVFYADFQLSFGISGALILVFNKLQQLSA